MPARELVLFPDPRLSQPAAAVEAFGPELAALAADLRDTLLAVSAIGLTAPHVGILRRVLVARMTPEAEPRVYVNPAILWTSSEAATHDEGSVSMPGIRERITRPVSTRIRYRDVAGRIHEEDFTGFPAAVMQHEIDQLDGLFWIHRLSRLKRDRLLKRYEKSTPSRGRP